jgi:hypothetical protein
MPESSAVVETKRCSDCDCPLTEGFIRMSTLNKNGTRKRLSSPICRECEEAAARRAMRPKKDPMPWDRDENDITGTWDE